MVKIINEVDFSGFNNNNGLGSDWVVGMPKEYIQGATLISLEEYKKYKEIIPRLEKWFWTRTSSGTDDTMAVYVDNYGEDGLLDVDCDFFIRPELLLKDISPLKLNIGDKFEFGNQIFTIISNNLAFCDGVVGHSAFRSDWSRINSNDYEKSDAKDCVFYWFDKAYKKYEG